MQEDYRMMGAFAFFLLIAITANETNAPMLAVTALLLMPVGALLAAFLYHRMEDKPKREEQDT